MKLIQKLFHMIMNKCVTFLDVPVLSMTVGICKQNSKIRKGQQICNTNFVILMLYPINPTSRQFIYVILKNVHFWEKKKSSHFLPKNIHFVKIS